MLFDVLKQKYPMPSRVVQSCIVSCDSSHHFLTYVDITAGHVEKVVRQVQRAAGLHGSSSLHGMAIFKGLVSIVLTYMILCLRTLARCLGNSIVEWDNVYVLVATALVRCSGVEPYIVLVRLRIEFLVGLLLYLLILIVRRHIQLISCV